MKKLLMFIGLILLTLNLSIAQDKPAPRERFGPNNAPLLRQLNLTDDQRSAVEKLRLDMMKKRIDQQARLKTGRLELAELFKAEKPDQAAIQNKVSENAQLQAQQRMMYVDHWFAVNKLLTPDQQKIWKQISGSRMMQQHARMMRGRAQQSVRGFMNQFRMRRAPGGPGR